MGGLVTDLVSCEKPTGQWSVTHHWARTSKTRRLAVRWLSGGYVWWTGPGLTPPGGDSFLLGLPPVVLVDQG